MVMIGIIAAKGRNIVNRYLALGYSFPQFRVKAAHRVFGVGIRGVPGNIVPL